MARERGFIPCQTRDEQKGVAYEYLLGPRKGKMWFEFMSRPNPGEEERTSRVRIYHTLLADNAP